MVNVLRAGRRFTGSFGFGNRAWIGMEATMIRATIVRRMDDPPPALIDAMFARENHCNG